jgi:CheY-like chemotaxis protein
MKSLRRQPPDAVVIDLSRMPSHGREVARSMRQGARLRAVPILFVDGEPEKVALIRDMLPDAGYCRWSQVGTALARLLADPPTDPVIPAGTPGAWTDRPVAVKLGIRDGMTVGTLGDPGILSGLVAQAGLGEVALRPGARGACELLVAFADSEKALADILVRMRKRADRPPLWIAWPKAASGAKAGPTQNTVRAAARAAGFMDSKICGLDATWSALRLTPRKEAPPT